jgi:uncharacterized membrane protein YbhN (UPF0104 family)
MYPQRIAWQHLWSIAGVLTALMVLAWAFSRVEYDRLLDMIRHANPWYALMVPPAIITEQLVRAWKWRQLLSAIRPVDTLQLFGAIMAGYFANLLVPLGISPFARSWLVARLEAFKMSAVLATVAIDRLIDGVIFTGFVAVVLVFAIFPDPTGNIRLALAVGGGGSLVLFTLLLFALSRYKGFVTRSEARVMRLAHWLPKRLVVPFQRTMLSFGDGVVWPEETWRSLGIVSASIVIKLIAITHFLLAGLAFGLLLRPLDYVFLVVFLGFLIILSRLVRVPGGFFLGAIFAFDLLGVPEEQALGIVLLVQVSNLLCIVSVGAFALWRSGIALNELRYAKPHAAGS